MKLKYIEPLLTKYRNDHQELYYDGKISIEDKRLDLAFREKEREIDLEERRTDKQILKSKAVEDEAKSFAKRQDAEEKALQFESSRRVELEKIVKLDEVIERHRSLDDFEAILNKEKERLVNEKNKYDLSVANADWYSVDKLVSKGDRVLIDFVGEIDGIPFDGGSTEGHLLVIGSNTMIPGFEDGFIGKKAGDETVIDLKFPDDYGAEDLKGKKVQFKVKIHKVESLMISINKLKLNSDISNF
uniref:Peptidyl-prolyl cis-trans isomerase n=1 Tax=Marinomonas sp. (strain MWYL1) TaxID=400668 RepID=A6VY91_MARMS